MTEIVISRRAQDDFKRIWRYIAFDNQLAADRLLLEIDKKIEILGSFPEMGTMRPDVRPGMRIVVHGTYLVLYEFDRSKDVVLIVAVIEGMRDLGRLF